jgi:SAM-dependent methyltransferase
MMNRSKASNSQVGGAEGSAGPTEGRLEVLIGRVLGQVSGGRVLDVATGEGGFVDVLRQKAKDYVDITGVDWDLAAAVKAREAIKKEDIHFCQMDAERLAFGDGVFDTANISASLHHLPNPGRVLGEMVRVTKPGGKLMVEEMHRDGRTEPQRVAASIHHWAADVDSALGIPHYPTLGRQELVDLVEDLGLEEVRFHDWVDMGSDPRDEALSEGVANYMEHRLQRAEGHPQYGALAVRAEALRRKLHEVGIQREPVIIIVGVKGS